MFKTGFINAVNALVFLEITISTILAFCMGILVFVSAVMRYLFNVPLGYSDELVAVMFVLASLFCVPYATRKGKNISLEVLVNRFSDSHQLLLKKVTLLVSINVVSILAYYGLEDINYSLRFDEVSEISAIPIAPIKMAAVFALFSISVALVANYLSLPRKAEWLESNTNSWGDFK